MDKKFLNKVVEQIVRETRIDYDEGRLYTPFYLSSFSSLLSSPSSSFYDSHCKEVYGLNIEEIDYVWRGYRRIIKDKIENNGL